ncbi:gliding motility-associated C-terminal domain-containing protein [Pedobacter sp. SYSU D00535]|uniref:gliding motility-associated C-terminal domain-containing protein n=1 Tax=Pedobacter sp. SYSU D00535 TaxID=2810308 RepID=UPI001A971EDD|nr:gliding motility-associated C-terminal domain-containing protein [Pedobacter sp. SYSU D00535]
MAERVLTSVVKTTVFSLLLVSSSHPVLSKNWESSKLMKLNEKGELHATAENGRVWYKQYHLTRAAQVEDPLFMVNEAFSTKAMQEAIESPELGLDLSQYFKWRLADRLFIAEQMFFGRGAGYSDLASVYNSFSDYMEARKSVAAINSATSTAEIKVAIENPGLGLDLTTYNSLPTGDQELACSNLLNNRPESGFATFDDIQSALDEAIAKGSLLDAVNNAGDASSMEAALKDPKLNLSLGAYVNWPAAEQTAVASGMLEQRPNDGYEDLASLQTVFDGVLAMRMPMVVVNIANDAPTMEQALEDSMLGLTLGSYPTWTTADRAAVALLVLSSRPASGYADVAALQMAFDVAMVAHSPVANVNAAASLEELKSALEDSALELNLGAYPNWAVADRLAVVSEVFASRPAGGFSNQSEVQNAFNAALDARAALAAVNTAATGTSMELALEDGSLGLTLGSYASWAVADRSAVATGVLNNRPVEGFEDFSALQYLFNQQVKTRSAIAAVNSSATVAEAQVALESPALALFLDKYFSWQIADRNSVAALVLENRPVDGYAKKSDIEGSFVVAMEQRVPVAKINAALSNADMRSAIEDATYGLDLSEYQSLNEASKDAACADLISQRPNDGYADYSSIQNALDLAIKKYSEPTDAEAVTLAKEDLKVTYQLGDNATSVTQNVNLATAGLHESTIIWSSNNSAVIAADGTVTRPSFTTGDTEVKLTATITRGAATETKDFDLTVLKNSATDAEAVTLAKEDLKVTYQLGDNATSVTQNVNLETAGLYGSSISWSSNNPAVIAADGTVTRPSFITGDTEVKLTATITRGAATETKDFDLTVLKNSATDAEVVMLAKEDLKVKYQPGDLAGSVTQNVTLETAGLYGSTISWSSTNPAVIAADGTVTRPSFITGDTEVELTATITRGAATETKDFKITVLKNAATDAEAVTLTKEDLKVKYQPGDLAGSVTQNVTLETAGLHGSTISWSSNNSAVIAADGTVTRPSFITGDTELKLTATITRGAATETKDFEITVLKNAATDAEAVMLTKEDLKVKYQPGDLAGSVTQNVTLETAGLHGSTISWSSNNPAVIAADGTVTRPSFITGDTEVELTATITRGAATETKDFEITVLKNAITDAEAVLLAKEDLALLFQTGDNSTTITKNIVLKSAGLYGTEISWISNKAGVIDAAGNVTRPYYSLGDAAVTLTATVSKNNASTIRTFDLKVLRLPEATATPNAVSFNPRSIWENQAAGQLAGDLVSTAEDPNVTFGFSLVDGAGDTDNSRFIIEGDRLKTKEVLNFEEKASYSVRVRSTTQFGFYLEREFVISLGDVNEQPTLDNIANSTICYTTTEQTVALSGITPGQDASQGTVVSVSTSNNAMFRSLAVIQAVDGKASVRYSLNEGSIGLAVVNVMVEDNGGTENGGVNTILKSFTLNVNPLPVIAIGSDKGLSLSKGETAMLKAEVTGGNTGLTYSWADANGIVSVAKNLSTLNVRPSETTTYTVTVTNANGCVSTQSITIEVLADFKVVDGTNIVTPNGDGVNDNFVIRNIDMYPNNVVKIFDRAGRLLYSKTNYSNEFNGTFQGSPLAEDTYYYIVDFGPGAEKIKGFITIVRD